MTEREFLQQVWRPYDTVVIENGIKGRVHSICFRTRSVRIQMPQGAPEWFNCDMIVEHKSSTGATEDLAIIEELHTKIMEQEKRIENLQEENSRMKQKLESRNIEAIGKNLNEIAVSINLKKKRIEKLESCLAEIEATLQTIQQEQP